jgi:hypothetical protein
LSPRVSDRSATLPFTRRLHTGVSRLCQQDGCS